MRAEGNYGNGWEKWEEMGAMRAEGAATLLLGIIQRGE